MPIEFKCTACDTLMRAADDAAGKKAKCPTCGEIVSIPDSNGEWAEVGNPYNAEFSQPSGQNVAVDNPYAEDPNTPAANPYAASKEYFQAAMIPSVAKSKVQPAAICMLIFSILNVLYYIAMLVSVAFEQNAGGGPEATFVMVFVGVLFIGGVLSIWGSICMLRMKGYSWAITGCVGGMISGISCCFLPSAIGLWGLIVLLDHNVKMHFE